MKPTHFCASVVLFLALVPTSCEEKPEHTSVGFAALPSCSDEHSDFVNAHQFGLNVQNLKHHQIFLFKSKKGSWNPINGFRATACGLIDEYKVSTGHAVDQREYDWNIELLPSEAFVNRLGEGMILGEVTPAVDLRNNRIFPPQGREDESPLIDKNICMYGPWVRDMGFNNGQREIHPAEAIWWQNSRGDNSDVELMLIQDGAITRFTEFCDFDFDINGDGIFDFEPGWAPWVEYPHMEEVKIPFQYDSSTRRYAVIRIGELRSLNIVTEVYPELGDDDDGATHKLKLSPPPDAPFFRDTTLVEVREDQDRNLGVQFTDVCKTATGIVRGNVRVLIAIGKEDTRDPGFIYLRVRTSFATNRPSATRNQR